MFLFFSLIRHTPRSPLFPYTTLFRSSLAAGGGSMQRRRQQLPEEEGIAWVGTRGSSAVTTGIEIVDRKSTRLNSSHSQISYAVFCLKKKKRTVYSIN